MMMDPKDIIMQKLVELEDEKNVRVLFCVEAGSRAWRIDSKDSDYDVRFVFIRPLDDYLAINPKSEVIKATYDKNGRKAQEQGCTYDFVGFDILKFARMLQSSNPQVIEWLVSDKIYYGNKRGFYDYALTQFKPIALYFHYKSMCRNNYEKYLKTRSVVTYKKYLYALRGRINAKYVVAFNKVPPIDFFMTLTLMKDHLPKDVIDRLKNIIRYKKKGREKTGIPNIPEFDDYIEAFLKDDSDAPKNKRLGTNHVLDQEVVKIIKEEMMPY
jgi:predicted nucleotidyltransferase